MRANARVVGFHMGRRSPTGMLKKDTEELVI